MIVNDKNLENCWPTCSLDVMKTRSKLLPSKLTASSVVCKISISGAVFQSQNANNNNLHPWSTVAHQSEEMTLKSTEKKMKEQNMKTSYQPRICAGAWCVINWLSNRTYYAMSYTFLNELIYFWILKATHQFKKIWAELIDWKVASWMWVLNVTKTGHSTSYTSEWLTCQLLASWFDSYVGIERRRLVHFLGITHHLHRGPSFIFIKGFRFEWGRMRSRDLFPGFTRDVDSISQRIQRNQKLCALWT